MAFTLEDWERALSAAIAESASDVHLAAESPLFTRVNGRLRRGDGDCPGAAFARDLLAAMTTAEQLARYQRRRELDFAWEHGGRRWRVNAYQQRTGVAMALRLIPSTLPTLAQLGAPPALASLLAADHGLVLVTGATGSGKTTTLAAFIDALNRSRALHIITLEDPVEYVHEPRQSLVSQRELGADFDDYATALRAALREAPDVILVGELRDADSVLTTLHAAESGHLVLATLHSTSTVDAALRLESFFPGAQQAEVRAQLAMVLRAIVAQRLLPTADGGRVCAAEVLVATAATRNLVRTGKAQQLPSVLATGADVGMCTLQQSIDRLRKAGCRFEGF